MRLGSISVPLLALALVAPPVHGGGSGLLPNPDFDDLDDMDIVEGWYELFENVSEMNNILDDADDCPFSGAGDGINTSPEDFGGASWSACTNDIVVGESYRATGVLRFPVGTQPSDATAVFIFTSELNCFGNDVGGAGIGSSIEHTTIDWVPFATGSAVAPAGAKAARVSILLRKYDGYAKGEDPNVADVYFDKIYFASSSFVFSEDFESGSACRWSQEIGLE